MKNLLQFFSLTLLMFTLLLIVGCKTPDPGASDWTHAVMVEIQEEENSWTDWKAVESIKVDGATISIGMSSDAVVSTGVKQYQRSDPTVIRSGGEILRVIHYFAFQNGKVQVEVEFRHNGRWYAVSSIYRRAKK